MEKKDYIIISKEIYDRFFLKYDIQRITRRSYQSRIGEKSLEVHLKPVESQQFL